MNEQKQIKDLTDLELAEAQGNLYTQFMQIQGNLIGINQEIQKRKSSEAKVSIPIEIKKD
jgi:hypothetical protein